MLKKLKESFNLVLLAYLAYGIKLLILPSTFADGLVLAVLAGAYGFSRYLDSKKPIEVNKDIKDNITQLDAEVKEIKGAISGVNLAKLKPQNKKYF